MALADLTSPDAVRQAIAEHNEIGQDAFLRKYGYSEHFDYVIIDGGREYPSKAVVGAAHGYQQPNEGPLPHTAFNGGRQTIGKLTSLGFAVRSRSVERVGLSRVLSETLIELASGEPDIARIKPLVTEEGPTAALDLVGDGWVTSAGVGVGTVADVPWFALRSAASSSSAQDGFYVVYLFAADGSAVYLSLSQGTEKVKGGAGPLVKRALDLRIAAQITEVGDLLDLQSSNARPRKYEAASAYAVRYGIDEIPDDAALGADLHRLLGHLTTATASGLVFDPELEPLHLLFKWSADIEAQTVELHRAVAEREGSVWWGKFGTSGALMSPKRLADIRTQLDSGVPTYAFLYGGGRAVRARLEDVTLDPSGVDSDRMTGYYAKDRCNLFVRIADFVDLPVTWAVDHLVLASNPDPAKVQAALSNQTTLLYVYERFQPDGSTAKLSLALQPELTREWLERRTLWNADALDEVLEALDARGQIILAGPPGTGKTWVADALARYLTQDGPGQLQTVQFHPSYGYEEFVEGIRPVLSSGAVSFERRDGVLLELAKRMDGAGATHVLVIDELNRANVPRVFGELLHLLEYRDKPLKLQHSDGFELPADLKLIATMNTADRSTRSIDVALRRRFEIFDCPADAEMLGRYYDDSDHTQSVVGLVDGFIRLNDELSAQLDRHHTIGQSFFMNKSYDRTQLERTWRRQIKPLIEDYLFDRRDVVDQFTLERFWPAYD